MMTKLEFLEKLQNALSGLPQDEIGERLSFYSEMIEDRMEEGLSEEQAVLAAGDIKEISEQIICDTPISKLAKERLKRKRSFKTWEIILLVLGSPVWVPFVIAAAAIAFSLYITLWSLIVSLWAATVSVFLAGFAFAASGIGYIVGGDTLNFFFNISMALVCAGSSVLLFFGCRAATGKTVLLTRKLVRGIKNSLLKKEEVQ